MERNGNVTSNMKAPILSWTNNELKTIDQLYPEESTSYGDITSPFTCVDGCRTSNDDNYFQFSKEIVSI